MLLRQTFFHISLTIPAFAPRVAGMGSGQPSDLEREKTDWEKECMHEQMKSEQIWSRVVSQDGACVCM